MNSVLAFGRLLIAVLALPLSAQNLQIMSPASAAAGRKDTLDIVLLSPAGKEPVALQWEFVIPVRSLMIDQAGIQTGPVAAKAGKTIYCAGSWKHAPDLYRFKCLLAGGRDIIPNGAVAHVLFQVQNKPAGKKAQLSVEQGMAVLQDLKKANMGKSEVAIAITSQ